MIIIFYMLSFIFLNQTSQAIFKNIVSMFVNNNDKNNFHYKNKKDNYLLIKIISGYIDLISDFNLKSLKKFKFIINNPSTQTILSMDSVNETSNVSFEINDNTKIIKNKNKNENKNIFVDNKTNNSELMKLNFSSSKTSLKNNTQETLKFLNNPQNSSEKNNLPNNITGNNNKPINSSKISKYKSINENKDSIKNSKKKKLSTTIKKEIRKNINIDDNLNNDEEKLTEEIFLKKLINNGFIEIKLSFLIFLTLLLISLIYISVKIIISVDFLSKIIEIFTDFGALSYRYSSIYYYFNSFRTLLVFPDFGNETILETMNSNMADKISKMNEVLDYKLDKYPSIGNYFWIAGTNIKKSRPSPSYIDETCYDNQKCREILNNKKYNILSEGLRMAITSMYQQIINIYEDYKKE